MLIKDLSKYILDSPKNKLKSSKKRALVVEDDPINMLVITNYLKRINSIEFQIAENGEVALKLI